jgi:spoIIIJ-associated protein
MAQDDEKTIDQLNEEADIAADYLEELLDIVDYEGDIEMGVRNNRPTVQIVADDDTDIKHLIGRNGEVVDALQQLTRLAVQQKTGERSHLIVDVDGYLKHKRQRLHDIALDAIDEACETGEPVDLKPMNSFERKIVHDVVREEGLKSRSHGEEPHRYVTVYLKSGSAGTTTEEDDFEDIVEI